ncbi:hypothetical protein [Nocardia pseudovaccinii]|uniref:hypothetical protein n=1 Tax=Nocardia pseudovaccinii TaxID=189540 RepID=UPI0012F502FF|nr:hypothetical protein [Nocardia pseudovaccinii]
MIVDHDVAKHAFVEPTISKKIQSPRAQAVMAEHGADGQYNGAINLIGNALLELLIDP